MSKPSSPAFLSWEFLYFFLFTYHISHPSCTFTYFVCSSIPPSFFFCLFSSYLPFSPLPASLCLSCSSLRWNESAVDVRTATPLQAPSACRQKESLQIQPMRKKRAAPGFEPSITFWSCARTFGRAQLDYARTDASSLPARRVRLKKRSVFLVCWQTDLVQIPFHNYCDGKDALFIVFNEMFLINLL